MSRTFKVAVLVGSLRKGSVTRKIANAIIAEAPGNMAFSHIEIGDLPLYNEDLDTDTPPPAWTRYREAMTEADAVMFVTSEYNRGPPASLKNAIDVGSRPFGKSVFTGKPAAVISGSRGAMGGVIANHQLRQMLVFFDMPVMAQPEVYIGGMWDLFDEEGNITREDTQAFLGKVAKSFAAWVERNAG